MPVLPIGVVGGDQLTLISPSLVAVAPVTPPAKLAWTFWGAPIAKERLFSNTTNQTINPINTMIRITNRMYAPALVVATTGTATGADTAGAAADVVGETGTQIYWPAVCIIVYVGLAPWGKDWGGIVAVPDIYRPE